MNKFSLLMIGAAALTGLAACSSDEPGIDNPVPGNGEGNSTMYLTVNICDANTRTRAEEGDLVDGSLDEHKVGRADFFFYDAKGNYVTNTHEVYSDGDFSDPDKNNIEWMGKNTLVLRNLDENNLPVYMITVLNAPKTFADEVRDNVLTIDATRKLTQTIKNESGNFIMSTTSFYGGDANHYDDNYYYANKLQSTDFIKEAATTDSTPVIDVYVERLAAKFQIMGLSSDNTYDVKVTIAGMDNAGGAENLKIKILGFGVSGLETESLISKNLDGFKDAAPFTDWNNSNQFRSFWGKSLHYGVANDLNNSFLSYTDFHTAEKLGVSGLFYGCETNTSTTGLWNSGFLSNRTPNYIIVAELTKADGTALEIVEYRGTYYTFDQFKKVVLARAQADGFELFTRAQTGTVDNGNGTTSPVYTYTGLKFDDYTFDLESTGDGTGSIKVVVKDINKTEDLYVKGTDNTYTKLADKAAAITTANTALKAITDANHAYGFKGGKMFYNIPVEHLLGINNNTYPANADAIKEGMYGVVRNHWYQLNINKVMGLGHGVFNPGSDTTPGEPIIPQNPDNDRYALNAKINILSWKIVKQSVDL